MAKYITSSFCLDGGCVGLDLLRESMTSSFCAKGECVSIEADTTDRQYLLIGDTKPENTLPPLRIDRASYESFWQSVLDGNYDLEKLSATPITSQGTMPVSVRLSDESDCRYPILLGVLCGCAETDRHELAYDHDEWQAFIDDIQIKRNLTVDHILTATDTSERQPAKV